MFDSRKMKITILTITILLLIGCSHILPYSFPEGFQNNNTELMYKGHKVREYKEYCPYPNNKTLAYRYFGYKNKKGEIINHGLYEGYYKGMVTEKILYSEGKPE